MQSLENQGLQLDCSSHPLHPCFEFFQENTNHINAGVLQTSWPETSMDMLWVPYTMG